MNIESRAKDHSRTNRRFPRRFFGWAVGKDIDSHQKSIHVFGENFRRALEAAGYESQAEAARVLSAALGRNVKRGDITYMCRPRSWPVEPGFIGVCLILGLDLRIIFPTMADDRGRLVTRKSHPHLFADSPRGRKDLPTDRPESPAA